MSLPPPWSGYNPQAFPVEPVEAAAADLFAGNRRSRPPLENRRAIVAMNKRPLSVTIIGCLYIVMGAIGFAYHFSGLMAQHPFRSGIVWVELLRLMAIVCGVYLLRGSNWARWLALAWMAFHVILSGFHSWSELAVHSLLFAAFAYFLFRPLAARYFRAART